MGSAERRHLPVHTGNAEWKSGGGSRAGLVQILRV